MKRIIIISLVLISSKLCRSQSYDELVRQKKTQEKYLLQQIAALKTYFGYAEKGYSIAKLGLSTISDIKHGDFNLHNKFFTSLSIVNPSVKKYSKVADIISLQISVSKVVNSTMKECKFLTAGERNYLQAVFNTVLDDCRKDVDELLDVITDSDQQMKDDERIRRIDKLYEDMEDKEVFVRSFSRSAKGLSVQRRYDTYDIQIQKKLNGLK